MSERNSASRSSATASSSSSSESDSEKSALNVKSTVIKIQKGPESGEKLSSQVGAPDSASSEPKSTNSAPIHSRESPISQKTPPKPITGNRDSVDNHKNKSQVVVEENAAENSNQSNVSIQKVDDEKQNPESDRGRRKRAFSPPSRTDSRERGERKASRREEKVDDGQPQRYYERRESSRERQDRRRRHSSKNRNDYDEDDTGLMRSRDSRGDNRWRHREDFRGRDASRDRRNRSRTPDRYNERRMRKRSHDRSPRNESEKNAQDDATQKSADAKITEQRQRRTVDLLTSKTGGAYIPPAKLRMLQAEITDKTSAAYQRIAWEALKKSIHGYINKVNVDNIGIITRELLKENIIRGRGLLCRSIIQAQAASPTFTHVYAALVAIINSKFPNIGELLLKRLVIQFKRGFRRNDKNICISSSRFIAHLVNQRVAHEILALEILTLLVETPTDDSVEVAIAFLKECGMKLTEVSTKGVNAIFEMLKNILHEGKLDKRVQYMIEVVFQVRKDGFKDHQSVIDALELVEEDDHFTHLIMLDEATDAEDVLNVFKLDEQYETNEDKYKGLSKELLGSDSSDSGDGSSGSGDDSGDEEDDDNDKEKADVIIDNTETNLVALRRTIYLTIHSSLDYEECAHKLMKMQLKPGQEMELCHMFLDCCAEQRTYEKFYGLLAQRFCMINKIYVPPFEEIFRDTYHTTHRLDTNRLRNVSKFFAHLLFTDAIGWDVFECIQLNEDDTTSSSRIFIKILFQELAEYMGLSKLNERLKDVTLSESFSGLFPRDNPRNTRFAINFFTSIGLGGLTDELREFLKTAPKVVPPVINTTTVVGSSCSNSSSTSSESSTSSSSSSTSSNSSESSSESDRESKKKMKSASKSGKSKKLRKTKSKKVETGSSSSSDDNSSDEDTVRSKEKRKIERSSKKSEKNSRKTSSERIEPKRNKNRTENRNDYNRNDDRSENRKEYNQDEDRSNNRKQYNRNEDRSYRNVEQINDGRKIQRNDERSNNRRDFEQYEVRLRQNDRDPDRRRDKNYSPDSNDRQPRKRTDDRENLDRRIRKDDRLEKDNWDSRKYSNKYKSGDDYRSDYKSLRGESKEQG